ncbi:transglycosylase family protein [Streptomyces sp. NPDC014006]|uniref:transglycosylase family protein n=1 Tax=Streptomyces sp. NPDC014006 TaxID=3364870 RepID=UPI00370219FF
MLSGNGRHRRPRQAPALLVAAGVTGSAIAIPLLGAASAHAADGTTWDKVAECESGGRWSDNPGIGLYGGLHLSQEDWEGHGGLEYAARPDLASRSQQIAVAEKVLADQGVGHWTVCGLTSGLSADTSAPDIDTGVPGDTPGGGSASTGATAGSDSSGSGGSTGSPDSSGSAGTSGSTDTSGSSGISGSVDSPGLPDSSGTPSGTAAGTPSTGSPAQPSDGLSSTTPSAGGAGESGASGSAEHGTSQPSDSASTGAANSDDPDNLRQIVGDSGLVDTGALDGGGRHRGVSAQEEVTEAGATPVSGRHASRYTVRDGDSLTSIADSLGVAGGWRALYAENQDAIGADPSHIVPGQTLLVGGETGEK